MKWKFRKFLAVSLISITASLVTMHGHVYAAPWVRPAAVDSGNFAEYRDASGLKIRYARNWKVEPHPDKDTVVKVSGSTQTGSDAEISVSIMDNGMNLQPRDFLEVLDKLLFSKIGKVSKVVIGDVRVGESSRLKGYSEVVTFVMRGIPMKQERLVVMAKGKLVTCILTTGEWQFEQALPMWFQLAEGLDGPDTLFEKVSPEFAAQLKPLSAGRSYAGSAAYCAPAIVITKPGSNWTLEQKIASVLPKKEEQRFLEIPWQSNVLAARSLAQQTNKPMFIWIMDGNVLGAT